MISRPPRPPPHFRAMPSPQAYDRMMAKTQDSAEQDAPTVLQPLTGTPNLLDDDAAGYCSGGVCHFPAPKTQ